jgi:NhaP-type Na+/H+ or K+/H+ antiporter
MLGAIVIVSGPTVVTPILDFTGLRGRVRGILQWEGTLLDPIGALVAVVVFQVIRASGAESLSQAAVSFLFGILVGVAAGVVGILLFIVGGRLVRGNELLGTQVLLGSVIVTAGVANFIADETGLIAALIMGMAAPRIAKHFGASLTSSQPFFGTVVSIGIGVLFVAIAALVPSETVVAVLIPTLVMSLVLILVLRPLVTVICTVGTDLSRRERAFIACMDPRGIVAAATASSVGAALIALKVPGAERLLPVAFIIVAVTVAVYGLLAVPIARLLRLNETDPAPVSAE